MSDTSSEQKWVNPPAGWTDLVNRIGMENVCGRFPDTCALTDSMMNSLYLIQGKALIAPWDGSIHWVSNYRGDCECKCLAMRDELVEGKFRRGELRLVLCTIETGQEHMVLEIHDGTDNPYILDPRALGVVRKSGLNYSWQAREMPGVTLWESLDGNPG